MKSINPLAYWDEFIKSTGYDHRKTQDELVELITNTLLEKGYLLGRAGTGTGKSLASVIPAVQHAWRGGFGNGPVIVSTATKALQGQYYNKDLPFMGKHYRVKEEGKPRDLKFSVLKGKRNYLCLDRIQMPTERIEPSIMKRIKSLPPEHEGDVSTLGLQKWQEMALTISSDDCPGAMDCIAHAMMSADDPSKGCFYEKAKKKAADSDVLVINHALLAAHIKILAATEGKIALLPQWSVLVADECHKLTGYIQNALGWHMSLIRLYKWANSCLDGEDLEQFKETAKQFFNEVVAYDQTDKKNEQQIQPRESMRGNALLNTLTETVSDATEEWMITASETRTSEDRRRARQCANLVADLEVALNPDNRDNFWVELDKQGNRVLYYKPAEKKCAEFMSEHLWPESPAILLSATTPTVEDLGLPHDSTNEFEADSPFDYAEQSRLYISKLDGAPPQDRYERELWEQNRHKEMLALVAASDGRALLLFTSWADLNKAHDALAPRLKQAGVTILRQQKEAESERDRLAKEFKEDERSVLFGTESFFEGIDIPGKSLQLVIISKMPFPAWIDNTRGGKLDFKTEMLPEMKMKVVQAAGRLIRTHSDRGLVAILDSRMSKKPYGRNILANVSPFCEMTQVRTLADAMKYLESLEEA